MRTFLSTNITADLKAGLKARLKLSLLLTLAIFCCLVPATLQAQDSGKGKKKQAPKKPLPFEKALIYNNLSFKISSPGIDTGNTVTITPTGLKTDNTAQTIELAGQVQQVLMGDIDRDGWPELVILELAPDKMHSSIHGYSVNMGRLMEPFATSSTGGEEALQNGYQGYDEYFIGEQALMHRFPIYKGSKKSGKTRQLQYSLLSTDDQKQLWFEKSSEY